MSNKTDYIDASLKEDKVKEKEREIIKKKTLKETWLEFRGKILSPTNLTTFIILALIFYSLMIYKDVVDVPQSIKFVPYFLLLGAMLSSYKTGKLNWSRITIWFTIGVIAIFVYGTFNELEKTRSKDKKEIGQKVYDGLVDRLTLEKAEAKIPPRNTEWMRHKVLPGEPTRLIRIYNGDKFIYKSPQNFLIIENYGKKDAADHVHNKSSKKGELRSFVFYDIPQGGRDAYILGVQGILFNISYKITNQQ